MKELAFLSPIFHTGRNITVRRGIKWSLESSASIRFGNGNVLPEVKFISTKIIRFCDIEDSDIDLCKEHDPECRDLMGLLNVMKKTYLDFDRREIVTVIEFDMP